MRLDIAHPNGTAGIILAIYETPDPLLPAERFLARCRFAGTGERSPVFHTAPTRESLIERVESFYRDELAKAAHKSQAKRGRPKKVSGDASTNDVSDDEVEEVV